MSQIGTTDLTHTVNLWYSPTTTTREENTMTATNVFYNEVLRFLDLWDGHGMVATDSDLQMDRIDLLLSDCDHCGAQATQVHISELGCTTACSSCKPL